MKEKIRNFLNKLIREYYSQGDNYFVLQTKKGDWTFGYSNDYPLQHGKGKKFQLPTKIIEILMSSKDQISTDDINKIIEQTYKQDDYSKTNNRYNEGWNDACYVLGLKIKEFLTNKQ